MTRIFIVSIWLALLLLGNLARGQRPQSPNTVKFTVAYDAGTQTYTAYLVPDYKLPNTYNTQTNEKGATAQFAIVVPKSFVITEVTDIKGTWAKAADLLKLGPGQPNQDWSAYNLDPNLNYYVIGKAATETDYGPFVIGQRVALFSFKGNGCFGLIYPLPPGSPFITAADQSFALNVANSFSSRSGQPGGGNQEPLEQFVGLTGPAANCTPVPVLTANPDNATITAGATATTPVLANDTNTGQPVTTANATVSITTQPTVGTVVVNPDGTISFTPPASFAGTACYTYQLCDLTSATACSAPAQVCVTVQAVVPPKVLTANPDTATITAGATATTPVLANDTNTGQPATTANAIVSITTQPTVGTVTVNPDGTISFTPPANFTGTVCYAYRICDPTSTTACSTPAQVCITVIPKPLGSADISIAKRVVGNKQQVLGGVVTFQIVVRNLGPDAATNVVVKDSLAGGLLFQSASATGGSFTNPLLTIPALASGDSVVVTVLAKVLVEGISFNYARVVSLDQRDPNAVNDSDQTCASVPVNLCTGETIVANVPAPFTDVTWYKAGVVVATGNTVTLTEGGTYTFTASNSTCPAEGCCPLVIVQTDCCPATACLPFVITKTRRK